MRLPGETAHRPPGGGSAARSRVSGVWRDTTPQALRLRAGPDRQARNPGSVLRRERVAQRLLGRGAELELDRAVIEKLDGARIAGPGGPVHERIDSLARGGDRVTDAGRAQLPPPDGEDPTFPLPTGDALNDGPARAFGAAAIAPRHRNRPSGPIGDPTAPSNARIHHSQEWKRRQGGPGDSRGAPSLDSYHSPQSKRSQSDRGDSGTVPEPAWGIRSNLVREQSKRACPLRHERLNADAQARKHLGREELSFLRVERHPLLASHQSVRAAVAEQDVGPVAVIALRQPDEAVSVRGPSPDPTRPAPSDRVVALVAGG